MGGGITQLANGQICANKMDMTDLTVMQILYTNVEDGGNPNNVEFFIDWDDGTTQTLFFSLGEIIQPAFPLNSFQTVVTHLFPATGGNVQCEYLPQIWLQFNGTQCAGSLDSPPPYVRWNTDNENTGNHVLAEENTGVVTFQVCAGDSFPVRFSDQSIFNCVPPAYANLINTSTRWTEFIYGTTNTITSATGVQVNGSIETYPFNPGIVDTQVTPVIVPFATTLDIQVPADALVGQEFEITMNSWNFCNPFGVDPPIVITARILIIASPPAPTVPPTDFCVGADPTITVSGSGGVFTWYKNPALLNPADVVHIGATFDPTSDPPPADQLNNSVPGSKTYYVTETLGVNNCEGLAATVTFNIIENPTGSAAGSDFSICTATSSISGNIPVVGTGFWTSSGPGNVVVGQETLPNANIENLVSGTTTTFTWTITNGVICVDASSVNVTRDLPPSPSNPGPDLSLCTGTTVNMTGVAPAVGIGTWSVVLGPGNVVAGQENLLNATIENLIPGTTTTVEWRISNGTCTDEVATAQIFDFLDPPSDAGADVFVCDPLTTGNLNAVDPTLTAPSAVGTWTWAGPGNVVAGQENLPNAPVENLVLGIPTTFTWTVVNGPCIDLDNVVVTVEASPDVAVASTPSTNICTTTSTVTGNAPASGTGLWTWSGGTGNVVAGEETLPAANVENISPGTSTTFTWTISTVACGLTSDFVTITNDSPTTSDAGSDQNICVTTTVLAANSVGAGETGIWTWSGGTGNVVLGEENLPNANVENLTQGTTTTFTWTIDNGICPISISSVDIIYDPAPTLSVAGTDQTVCSATTSLSGNLPGAGETGTWTWSGGTGNVVVGEETLPNANVENLSQSTSTSFTWQIDNKGCTGIPSSLIVTRVNDLTIPMAGSDQNVCLAATMLSANAVTAGETGTWTWAGGTGFVVPVDVNNPNANVDGLSQGTTTTFTWTISNGICTDLQSSADITRSNNLTIPDAGMDQNVCISTSPLSANSVGAGETGTWTWSGGSGNVLAGQVNLPNASVENLTQGTTTTFTWTITNGLCTPLTSDVMVTFDELPTSSAAGPDQIVCAASTTLEGNDVSSGIGIGTWSFAPTNTGVGGTVVDPALYNSAFNGIAGETYVLRWTISNGSCTDSFSDVRLDFSSALPATTISGDAQACVGDAKTYIVPGGNPTLHNYTWDLSGLPPSTSVVAGTGSPFQFITLQFNDPVTAGILGVVSDDGFCFGPLETFSIDVFQTPLISLSSSDPDLIICENESVTFTATDALGLADNYEFQVNGITVQSSPFPTYTTTSLTSVDQVVVIGTAGGICPASSTPPIAHTVNPLPASFSIQGGGSYCDEGIGVVIGLDGSEFGTTYELYLDGNSTGVTQSPSGGAFDYPPQTTVGVYTILALTGSNCGEFMAGNTSIIIDILPEVYNVTGGGEFCAGDDGVPVGLDNSDVGINYQLFRDGVVLGNSVSGTGSALNFGLQAIFGNFEVVAANDITFCAKEMAGVGVVTLIPNPTIIVTNNIPRICSGFETSIDLESSLGTTFTWTVEVSDESLTGAVDETEPQPFDTIIKQQLENDSEVDQTATYIIKSTGPTPTFCVGDTKTVDVIVSPNPSVVFSGSETICKGNSTQLSFEITGKVPLNLVYTDGEIVIPLNGIASTHVINVSPAITTSYSVVSVTDANGCIMSNSENAVTVTVVEPIADFSTVEDLLGCSPLEVTFMNENIESGVTYEWTWGDGSPSTRTSDEVISHVFENNSTSILTYNISLIAEDDLFGCQTIQSNIVEVFPSVGANLDVNAEDGCAPVTVSFINNSIGVSDHKWYFRVKGSSDENEVITSPVASYLLENKTTAPIQYEIVYEASNGFCSESIVTEVLVLPEVLASFTISDNPVEVTSTPHVSITNTTLNKAAWSHIWEWGDGMTATDVDPGSHTYLNNFGVPTYGTFQIKQNILYKDDFGECEASFTETLNVVPVLPKVDFIADVLEGCLPLTVNFTNLSESIDEETVSWEFISSGGAFEGTSSQYHTKFIFFEAGKYTVRLTAGNPIGITESETKELYITVNEIPTAGFTLRPDLVYLPDGVVFTQNQSTLMADEFFWIFNVIDYFGSASNLDIWEGDLTSSLYEPQVLYKREGFKDIMLISTISTTGCSDTVLVEKAVFVDKGGGARIPNAFTPTLNGPGAGGIGGADPSGGFNEVFLPVIQGLSEVPGSFHMLIYDRWGNLLFETWDENVGWDGYAENGKLLPLGVYVYKLDLKFVDGSATIRIGDVTLIR